VRYGNKNFLPWSLSYLLWCLPPLGFLQTTHLISLVIFCLANSKRRQLPPLSCYWLRPWCFLIIDLVPFLSHRFLNSSSDSVFMQDSAPCSAHRAKATQDDLRNVVPDLAVEKTSVTTAAVTKHNGDQFNTFSVEHLLMLLINLCFFCILTCNTTLLSISVNVTYINIDFCVHINECLLTANMYLVWFTSA